MSTSATMFTLGVGGLLLIAALTVAYAVALLIFEHEWTFLALLFFVFGLGAAAIIGAIGLYAEIPR